MIAHGDDEFPTFFGNLTFKWKALQNKMWLDRKIFAKFLLLKFYQEFFVYVDAN